MRGTEGRFTYLAHGVVIRDQGVDSFNRQEALIHSAVLGIGVEDVGCDDSCKIVNVHLASRVLVHVREG